MDPIKVPKTPKSAFNKNRKASGLLLAQIEHLEAAAGIYSPAPAPAAAPRSRSKGLTEGQAAAYIQSLTRQIEARAGEPYVAAIAAPSPTAKAPSPRKRSVRKPQRPIKKAKSGKAR